jgi:hypothetical protein
MSIRIYNLFKKKFVHVFSDVGKLGRSYCTKCDAKLFDGEGKKMCCADGKVKVRPLHPATEEMKSYFDGNNAVSRDFLNKIRSYNSRFRV